MNETEKETLNNLNINNLISKLQTPAFQIKYIENIGYVLIREGYLILDDGIEPTNYFVNIYTSPEKTKTEITNLYKERFPSDNIVDQTNSD